MTIGYLGQPCRSSPRTDPRGAAIEGLRGVVVAAVVGYHLLRLLLTRDGGNWGDTATAWWWWAGVARFGVDVFFVLSGLFVVASWRSCREAAATRRAAARQFAVRRAQRILPPFWLTVVAFGVPALLASTIGWRDLALLMSTQQYLDPQLPDQVNLPSWSLTTEVQFYAVVPVVALAVRWLRGWPLLLLTVTTSTWWIHSPGRGDLPASLLAGRLDQFVAGAVAGQLLGEVARGRRPWAVRTVTRRGAGLLLVALLVALGTYHGATFQQEAGGHGLLEDATHPMAGVLIAALVLRWLAGPAPAFFTHRAWRFLGTISFGLYLWHYPVLEHGLEWLGIRGDDAAPSGPAMLLASTLLVAIAVGLAMASYLLVERPGLRRRRELPRTPTASRGEELSGRLAGRARLRGARQHA